MGKILLKLTENKPLSATVKIAVILTVNILLRYFILPSDFMSIDSKDFIHKYLNNETLSFTQWFIIFWNRNISQMARFFVLFIIIILFRFRFKKSENFRFSRHTITIALLCFIVSLIGFSYLVYYDFLYDGLVWQERIADVLWIVFIVALFEEFIYRGYITNELFRLKQNGLKTSVAIAISAVIFGFIHLQRSIMTFFIVGSTHSILNWGTWEQFIFTVGFGVSMAIILYYKNDIISLICIHAANNILDFSYWSSGESMLLGVLYVLFVVIIIIIIVCYPTFLIYKEMKKRKALFG